jgi:hypothetical protein
LEPTIGSRFATTGPLPVEVEPQGEGQQQQDASGETQGETAVPFEALDKLQTPQVVVAEDPLLHPVAQVEAI